MPARYANDPRVESRGEGHGFTVHHQDGSDYYVLHTDPFAWTICHGPNLDFVPTAGGGFAIGIDTATHAIGALIGDPIQGGQR